MRVHLLPVAVLAGLLAGVAAKWVDQSEIDLVSRVGGLLLSQFGAWALVIVILARWSRTPRSAVLQSAVFFLAMCVGYYAMTIWHYNFGAWVFLRVWGLAAVTAVPLLAAGLSWATRVSAECMVDPPRRRQVLAGLVIAVPAGVALGEAVGMWEFFGTSDPAPAGVSAVIAVAAIAVLARTPATVAGAVLGALPVAYLTWQAKESMHLVFAWLLPRL